jgi:hypothetical protein
MKKSLFRFTGGSQTGRFFMLLFVFSTVLWSCKKEPSKSSGSASLIYASEEYADATTNFVALLNTAELPVENASPYANMIGDVMVNALSSTMNGSGMAVSQVEITNVRVSALEIYSGYDFDVLTDYLTGAQLVLSHVEGSTNPVSVNLGSMINFNTGEKKVVFSPSSADLTDFLKGNPDDLHFDLQFNGVPGSSIDVKYKVVFDYQYAYELEETD